LFLRTPTGTEAIRVPELTRAELSLGPRRHAVEGALIGGAVGAVIGVLFHRLCTSEDRRECASMGAYAAGFGLGVGLVSGIAGYSTRTERWREFHVPGAQ
jgi:hypothetical protein